MARLQASFVKIFDGDPLKAGAAIAAAILLAGTALMLLGDKHPLHF